MRQLFFEGAHKVNWHDVPAPKVQADHEVLVATVAATTCDVDKAVLSGMSPFRPPFAIGHESVARIIDMGDSVSGFEIGDIVSVPYHRMCGVCGSCRKNQPLHCEKSDVPMLVPSYGFPHAGQWGGMFSETYRVPWASHALVKVPDTVDPIAAVSMGDNLTDAWSTTVPHIKARNEAKVLIMSFGGYGLYATQWALSAGAELVTYVDHDEARLRLAKSLGADPVTWRKGAKLSGQYDVIVNARPGVDSLQFALLAAAPGAHCSNTCIFFENVPLPLGAMHYSGVTLQSTYSPTRNYMADVAQALAEKVIDPRKIETEIVDLDSVPERLADPTHKPIVIFSEFE